VANARDSPVLLPGNHPLNLQWHFHANPSSGQPRYLPLQTGRHISLSRYGTFTSTGQYQTAEKDVQPSGNQYIVKIFSPNFPKLSFPGKTHTNLASTRSPPWMSPAEFNVLIWSALILPPWPLSSPDRQSTIDRFAPGRRLASNAYPVVLHRLPNVPASDVCWSGSLSTVSWNSGFGIGETSLHGAISASTGKQWSAFALH
jgi:hypothetical protein